MAADLIMVKAQTAPATVNFNYNMNIQTFNEFLPLEILNAVDQEIIDRGWHYGWRSRAKVTTGIPFGHWNIDFTKSSSENGLDVSDSLPDSLSRAWQYIQENYCAGARLLRCYINGHTYGIEGYPHTDAIRIGNKTLLIYLNGDWNRDWGGETVFYDDNEVLHAELPKRNKAVLFEGSIAHVAKGVTRACPHLRATLMFKIAVPESFDSTRDQIQEFLSTVRADDATHSSNNLTGHLLRTYDYLKQAGQSQDVCNAGAVHSIFGTNIFDWKERLSYDDRPRIAAVVGEPAVRLAEIFSKIPRPGILETYVDGFNGKLISLNGPEITVSREDFDALCAIEAANLYDQKGLGPYPKLEILWQKLNTQ